MSFVVKKKNGLTVKAYKGDCMTMLCFDLDAAHTAGCVGFSIEVVTPSGFSFFIPNRISFTKKLTSDSDLEDRVVASTPSNMAPIQKFRWLHVPASGFDGKEECGKYKYIVTPRFWANDALDSLDKSLSVEVSIMVEPFVKGDLSIGFTRGFMISQAYARRFGNDSKIEPEKRKLLFDLSEQSGTYPQNLKEVGGKPYSYKDQYEWMGWQARDRVIEVLNEVIKDGKLSMDVFAYDLNEPEICEKFLLLAEVGRIRIILDNSSNHVSKAKRKASKTFLKTSLKRLQLRDRF